MAPYRALKGSLYSGGTLVPAFIRHSDVAAAGGIEQTYLTFMDILPTLVELAGGDPASNIDGRSFAPVLRGETDAHRSEVYTTHSGDRDFNVFPMRSVRTADWKYIRNLHPEFQFATHINRGGLRSGRRYWPSWIEAAKHDEEAMAIVERYRRRAAEELYYVANDNHEQHNLAADPRFSGQLARMRTLLHEWLQQTNDPLTVFGNSLMHGEEPTIIE